MSTDVRTGTVHNALPTRSRTTRRGFWLEAGAAGVSAVLALLTVVAHRWVEVLLGAGAGSLEWLLVRVLVTAALVLAVLARDEWHRTVPA